MNRGQALTRHMFALLALCLLGAHVDAQQLGVGHGPLAPLAAGNDGVGGIEWHAPKREPQGGFKQGNGSVYAPPPKQPGKQPPSPLSVAPPSGRPLARTLRAGRDGELGALQLTPLAAAGDSAILAIELSGALPGAQVWIAVAAQPSARPLAGGLLGLLPERMVPAGRVEADGRVVLELPEGVSLDGLVLQALVREPRWASSPTLQVLSIDG